MIKKESGEKRKFDTGAEKQHAAGKGMPVLFPGDAYLEICKHFEEGGITHGARNWEKGIPLSELMNSLERHIAQEKMGLTDESHDRAIAWNAVVYLATKLRVQAGLLPSELDDLEGVYGKSEQEELENPLGFMVEESGSGYYIYDAIDHNYLCRDFSIFGNLGDNYKENYFKTKEAAEEHLAEYLKRSTK